MFHAGTSQENEKRRQQYMLDLKMRADLDDRVLQAVKLNKRTGQSTIPLTDMRTLDEKMQDLERLKSTVRLDLLTITDAANATEILGGLSTHDLQFVAQKFPLMSAEIKPKYKMGITAAQFFQFLREYERVDATQLIVGRPVGILDLEQILGLIALRGQVEEVADMAEAVGMDDPIVQALRAMALAAPVVPLVGEHDAGALHAAAALPNRAELDNLLFGLEAGDPRAFEEAAAIPAHLTDEALAGLLALSTPRVEKKPDAGAAEPNKKPKRATRGDVASRAAKQDKTARLRAESLALGIPVKSHGKFLKLDQMEANIAAKTDALREESAARGLPVKDSFSGAFLPADVLRVNIKDSRVMNGESIEGFGVRRRMHGRGIASIDDKIALGRYNINTRKLADNIVQLRSAKGGAIHKFPTTTVSDNVRSALHKIISGGDLTFDDISGLSEGERRYLHDVSTQCGIKTSIPKPKDEVSAQADRYLILKGQIIAGQDNEDVIREFKALIMKMSNSGQLPKGQVREVLLDLVALGK